MLFISKFDHLTEKIFSQRNNLSKEIRKINFVAALKKIDVYANYFKIITITGTNGKSSIAHMLSTALMKDNKVGTFTSPHVMKVNERIKINNSCISDNDFIDSYNEINKLINLNEFGFFEVMTLLALFFFSKNKVNFSILECGIGAQWDCVNYIPHEYGILTSVGKDHELILGNSLRKIVENKICVANNTEKFFWVKTEIKNIDSFIEKYLQKYNLINNCFFDDTNDFSQGNLNFSNYILKALNFSNLILSKCTVPYRFAAITENIYVDPAHNKQGFEALIEKIKTIENKKFTLIVGFNKEKKYIPIIKFLKQQNYNVHYVYFDSPQSLKIIRKKELAHYSNYLKEQNNDEIRLFTGSFHFIGNVLKYLDDRALNSN